MSAVDWRDTEHDWDVVVEVVSQHRSDVTFGELKGVQIEGSDETEGYYSDHRVQGTVVTVVREGETDGYVPMARLRIVLRVPRWDWERELITGFVTDIRPHTEGGTTKREYTLDSSLWGVSEDLLRDKVVCGAGASALEVVRKLLADRGVEYDDTGAIDRSIASLTVYEPGTSILTTSFEVLSGTDRLDVSGHGPITIRPYVPPSSRMPTVTIDTRDPRSMVVGDVTEVDGSWERPGAALVSATVNRDEGSQEVRAGSYVVSDGDQSSRARRGYLRFEQGSYEGDSEDPTLGELAADAKKLWDENDDSHHTWDLPVLYMDLRAGDMVWFVQADGAPHRCLVQTVTNDLGARVQRLTLKEV